MGSHEVAGIGYVFSKTRQMASIGVIFTSTYHTKQLSSPGNFQHQYLAELLVNVYSYRLMVKSVSCYCVRGSRLFSDLVTYVNSVTPIVIKCFKNKFFLYIYHCVLKMFKSIINCDNCYYKSNW